MINRGYNHKSNLKFTHINPVGKVDIQESLTELISRCLICKRRLIEAYE